MSGGGLNSRSTTDDPFYEWLLSDHPDAQAERDYRRGARYQRQRGTAADIAAWADRISADPDRHTRGARDLAATIGPRAADSAMRAEIDSAEPDEVFVARLRQEFEIHRHVHWDNPDPSYRYPAHLTGPGAASYPPPPEPGASGRERGAMTSWEGPGVPAREPVRLGLRRHDRGDLVPWLALEGEVTTDGPCVVEIEAGPADHHAFTDALRANAALTSPEPEAE